MDNVLNFYEAHGIEEFVKKLEAIFDGYRVISGVKPALIDRETALNTAVIFGNPGAEFLKLCPRLKWLQLQSAGTNGYVSGEVGGNVLLTCASGCYGHSVSEHMIALTLSLIKKLHLYRDNQSAQSWQGRGTVKSVRGAVVLVIGLGDIGSNYAKGMKALGSYIAGIARSPREKPEYCDEFLLPDKLDDALTRADVIALSVPGTKDTACLIDRRRLALIKKGAILINAGRGSVIDTEALCDALESGALGGAGLDVTDPEPLPPGHRLWRLSNAVITPHSAGGGHLPETAGYITGFFLDNARRFVKGEPLESVVDFNTGYRKR